MTDLVLFHSACGLRPAVHDAAERIRALGLTVHTPDLYEGRVASTAEEGRAIRDEIGVPTLIERCRVALDELDLARGVVYSGFSMGAAAAQHFALADPASRALLLFHGAGDIETDRRLELPMQLHIAEADAAAQRGDVVEWERAVRERGGSPEVFWYADGGHLYTDPGLPDYHAGSAELTWQRALDFLSVLR